MRLLLILSCLGSVVLSLGMTSPTYAAKAAHWTTCTFRLDHTEAKTCVRHRMPRHHKHPTGHRKHCSWTGSDWRCVTYPSFKPKAPSILWSEWVEVTGYSYTVACGDVNGITADPQNPVPIPFWTIASNNAALWHHHVYVPPDAAHPNSFSGYVSDRGAPLDLFMPSCQDTYAITGYRLIDVYP